MTDAILVLRSDPSDKADLETLGVTIQGLVMLFEHPFLRKASRRKSDAVVEHVWQEQRAKGAATVVMVDDVELPGRYLYVSCDDSAHGQNVWRKLEYLLPVLKRDDLLAAAKSNVEAPGSLTRLAMSLRGFDADGFQLIASSLAHASLGVRMDAAQAVVCLKWKRFRPELEAALARETDEEGRKGLAFAIELLEKKGVDA